MPQIAIRQRNLGAGLDLRQRRADSVQAVCDLSGCPGRQTDARCLVVMDRRNRSKARSSDSNRSLHRKVAMHRSDSDQIGCRCQGSGLSEVPYRSAIYSHLSLEPDCGRLALVAMSGPGDQQRARYGDR